MANLFLSIPVPAGDGSGAAVDVSALGKTKTFVCGGTFDATINLEIANDDLAAVWAPLATFYDDANVTVEVAARWVRATVSSYASGSATVNVGASDSGASFVQLLGDGTPADISALALYKTIVAPGSFAGNVEVSEDGTDWAQIWSMQDGGQESRVVVGSFARAIGSGEDVWIGGASDGGGGSSAPTTEHRSGAGGVSPPRVLDPSVDTSFLENTGDSETVQIFTLADGSIDGQIHNLVNESSGNTRVVRVIPANLWQGTQLNSTTENASAALIWNANSGAWHVLGSPLDFTVS